MKRLRNIISWMLVVILCCGEITPQMQVFAAGTPGTEEEQVTAEDSVSVSDEGEASGSSDAAADDEEADTSGAEEAQQTEEDLQQEGSQQAEEDASGEDISDSDLPELTDPSVEADDDGAVVKYSLSFSVYCDQSSCRDAAIKLNKERRKNLRDKLVYDNGLEELACRRAAEAAIYFSEYRPDGSHYRSIYDDSVNIQGCAVKEILIYGDSENAADTADKAVELLIKKNSILANTTGYTNIAIGHIVYEGVHYWAAEINNAVSTGSTRAAVDGTVVYTMNVLENYINVFEADPTVKNGSTIDLDTGVEKELPVLSAYITTRSQYPADAKRHIVIPSYSWTMEDPSFGSIKDGKVTALVSRGDTNVCTSFTVAGRLFEMNYKLHVLIHVESIKLSLDRYLMAPGDNQTVTVVFTPADADDRSFDLLSDDKSVVDTNTDIISALGRGTAVITAAARDRFNEPETSSVTVTVEATQTVEMPKVAEPDKIYGKYDTVRLYTDTPDAEIRYLTVKCDESGKAVDDAEEQLKLTAGYEEHPELFMLYTGAFKIGQNTLVRAIAMKEAIDPADPGDGAPKLTILSAVNSVYLKYSYDVWGDITEEDRLQFASASEIPDGLWVAKASIPVVTYNGKAQRPGGFRVYDHNRLLDTDSYTVSYKNNINAGTEAKAVFKFKGSYSRSLERSFTISPMDISAAQVSNLGVMAPKNGKEVTPRPRVILSGKILKADKDYTLSYTGPLTDPGTYTLKISGIGNYCGDIERDYVIASVKKDIPAAETLKNIASVARISGLFPTYSYNGEARTPEPDVVDKKTGEAYVKGVDYTVSYQNNIKAGTGKVIVSGLESGGYKGSITKTFTISKVSLKTVEPEVEYDADTNFYQKGGTRIDDLKVSVIIDGRKFVLTEGVDYTVSYANNKSVPKAGTKKTPYFIITGKGNFKDRTDRYGFNIYSQALGSMNVSVTDLPYKDKTGNYKTKAVITDVNGKKLIAGTDYDNRSISYTYDEAVWVMNNKQKVFRQAWDPVDPKDIVPAGTALHMLIKGKGNYVGVLKACYKVAQIDLSKARPQKISDRVHTGMPVTLSNDDIKLTVDRMEIPSTAFEIVGYSSNTAAGTAKVVIRGTGKEYGGMLTIRFKIVKKPAEYWVLGREGDNARTERHVEDITLQHKEEEE